MPPRCPECGRFLSTDLVRGLRAGPAPCPRCDTELTAEMFVADEPAEVVATGDAPPAGPDAAVGSGSTSVRPPDLPPADIREVVGRDDVLAGWDADGAEGSRQGETVVALSAGIIGGGVIGGLIGGFATRRHRSLGAVIGTLLGALLGLAGTRAVGPTEDPWA